MPVRVFPFPISPPTELDILLFDFAVDSAVLRPEHIDALKGLIAALGRPGRPLVTVSIDGFASHTGTAQHNLLLSQRREQEVAAFLRGNSRLFAPLGPNRIDTAFEGFTGAPPGENPMFRSVRVVVHPPGVRPRPVPIPPSPTPVGPSRRLTVSGGTISWIHGDPSPIRRGGTEAATLAPAWVPKTYVGLAPTSNPPPPAKVDFSIHRASRQFRAMTFWRFEVEIDAGDRVSDFKLLEKFVDGGFTPPFNIGKFPAALIGALFEGGAAEILDRNFFPGEASVSSDVVAQARHPNSALSTVPTNETVLVDSLIKFRAGKHTDDIGVNTVGAPFHVPWVWCEMVLTYAGAGRFNIFGRGSIFPSHAWFLNDQMVTRILETGDTTFPVLGVPPTSGIDVPKLRLFPVLAAGAPGSGAQSANMPATGPVTTNPNAAPGGGPIAASQSL
jgi:hypothetical protein